MDVAPDRGGFRIFASEAASFLVPVAASAAAISARRRYRLLTRPLRPAFNGRAFSCADPLRTQHGHERNALAPLSRSLQKYLVLLDYLVGAPGI